MICTNCGSPNEPGRKFCGECGAPLARVCPACGTSNPATVKFCGECGAPLAPGASPPARPGVPAAPGSAFVAAVAPAAERRVVSVLFADLVGFTALSADRDPEETRAILTCYFDLARDVIARYGGTVEKFIGDAVMAVWGAPTAHEDDAERAVRAGLELVDAVRTLGPSLTARAGVLTGEAAVSLGATNQGMVAGDLVNTASRLQGVAAPGAVLVGEATQRAASKAIAFEEVGEQALRGKVAPVPAWRALRVAARVGGRNRSDTLEAPFVGREDEFRQLKDLFHATAREKRTRLVSVIGPAGFGKTRLAWELHKYLDGLVERVRSHDGRSPAYGDGITFWALGEMVRGRAGLSETDDEPTTRAKIAETVREHVPDEAERRWIEAALLALLGIESGVGSDQLFGAWRTFFERLAATTPVVMVFEDFHNADSGTIDFVDHLMEWSRNLPIFIVTLARPELLDRRETWGAGKRNFTSIYLDPLSESAMRELLTGLVPGLPESAVRAIVARADGIPLYAVETVRMLLAEGRLELRDGVHVPTGDLTTLAVPETLTALIASRLDGLGPADRALVSDAAVIGQSFTPAALAAVSGIAEPTLQPRLAGLVRRELLTLEADPRNPERGQYAFVQALIREVAYNTLARADRKTRHLAAARYFESLGMDELAGALAGHYLAARENAPEGPERDALAAQARVALRRAAERAASLGAHGQAAGFFEQALSATTDAADRAEFLERAGAEASAAGRHEAAERHLHAALALRRELGDAPSIAAATAALGNALNLGYRNAEAIALLEPAVAEFADLADHTAAIALGGQLARAHFLNSNHERAIEMADHVLAAAERADLRALVADLLVTKGTALAGIGRRIEGLALLAGGQAVADGLGLGLVSVRAAGNRSDIEARVDPRAALETARECMATARRLGARSFAMTGLSNAAEAASRIGDWAWAAAELDAALADEVEVADRSSLLSNAIVLAVLRGEPAGERLAELTRLVGDAADPQMASTVPYAEGFVAFSAHRLIEARTAWQREAALLPQHLPTAVARGARAALWAGDGAAARADLATLEASPFHGPAIDADRTTLRAGLLALEGRRAEALALYRDALRAWRALGLLWDEALAGIDMATLLDPADPEVRTALDRSREILVELGATPFLDRLAALVAPEQAAGTSPTTQPQVDALRSTEEAATS